MSITRVLRFIINHPLNKDNKFAAVLRFIKWQFKLRTATKPIIYAFTNKSKLVIEKGMTGVTGNLYCGLHEFNDMGFLLHFLRPGDAFADIGANAGSFSMLASAHVGAKSLTFEPVPATFRKLQRNIEANQIGDKVTAYNAAVGGQSGTIRFTQTMDTKNHVATPDEAGVDVPVMTVDQLVTKHQVPILMKIDVEGFETEVINGAHDSLKGNEVKALIMELPGFGERYGYDETKLHDRLLAYGFKTYTYNPKTRNLKEVGQFGTYNTLYLRDLDFISQRLQSAEPFQVWNKRI